MAAHRRTAGRASDWRLDTDPPHRWEPAVGLSGQAGVPLQRRCSGRAKQWRRLRRPLALARSLTRERSIQSLAAPGCGLILLKLMFVTQVSAYNSTIEHYRCG